MKVECFYPLNILKIFFASGNNYEVMNNSCSRYYCLRKLKSACYGGRKYTR